MSQLSDSSITNDDCRFVLRTIKKRQWVILAQSPVCEKLRPLASEYLVEGERWESAETRVKCIQQLCEETIKADLKPADMSTPDGSMTRESQVYGFLKGYYLDNLTHNLVMSRIFVTSDDTYNKRIIPDAYQAVSNAWRKKLKDKGAASSSKPEEQIITSIESSKISTPKIDWGDAPEQEVLLGRQDQLHQLNEWISREYEHCRVVAVLGMGGIGKTSVAVQVARQLVGDFDYIIWRSLQNAPPLQEVIRDFVDFISDHEITELPNEANKKILILINLLKVKRCLLILDNFETILKKDEASEYNTEGYENFGDLVIRLGTVQHNSCLLLTSREKPREIALLEGKNLPIRSLPLLGLDVESIQDIIKDKSLSGNESMWKELVESRYGGNPFALRIISEHIREIFDGRIESFLEKGSTVIGDIRGLLNQQFNRLSEIEQHIMYWLAIEREPTSLEKLKESLVFIAADSEVIEALSTMRRRYLVERTQNGFTLQNLVMEYITEELVKRVCTEIVSGTVTLFNTHSLLNAQSKEYIMSVQRRMILRPLIERLVTVLSQAEIVIKVRKILSDIRRDSPRTPGYAAANVFSLLSELNIDLQNWDFSNLTVRKAYLQELELHDVDLSSSDLSDTVFADTFGSIPAVAFNHTGDKIVAGTFNGEVIVWQTFNGKQLLKLAGHSDWVSSICISPNDDIIATGSNDQSIRMWKLATGECIVTLKGHTKPVRSVAFSSDAQLLASASEDSTIRLWKTEMGECVGVLSGHVGRLKTLAFSPDGSLIASGGDDQAIRLWDVNTKKCVGVLKGHTGWIRTVAFHPNSKKLASGSDDGTVRIWNLETRLCGTIIKGDTNKVWVVAFSGDGSMLVSGGNDSTIKVWNSDDGQLLKVLQGHTSWVRSIQFGSSSHLIVSGGEDQTVRLWDLITGHCLRVFRGYTGRVFSVSYGPDADMLVAGIGDHKVHIWRVNDGVCVGTLRGHMDQVWTVAFSPSGRTIVSGSDDRTIRLWDIRTMQCLATLQGHKGWIGAVVFSPDGTIVASGSDDYTICLWNVSNGQLIRVLHGHEGRVSSLAFLPNNKGLVSGSEDATLRLWDLNKGECECVLRGHDSLVYSVACSPLGSIIASGGSDRTVRLWNADTRVSLGVLGEHSMQVWSVAFSLDSNILASGSDDRTIRLWDVNSRECIGVLEGHSNKIWSVAFSSDNRLLASGSEDETIRIWDIDTRQCISILRGDRPYERMNIFQAIGLTDAQKSTLRALGAMEQHFKP